MTNMLTRQEATEGEIKVLINLLKTGNPNKLKNLDYIMDYGSTESGQVTAEISNVKIEFSDNIDTGDISHAQFIIDSYSYDVRTIKGELELELKKVRDLVRNSKKVGHSLESKIDLDLSSKPDPRNPPRRPNTTTMRTPCPERTGFGGFFKCRGTLVTKGDLEECTNCDYTRDV